MRLVVSFILVSRHTTSILVMDQSLVKLRRKQLNLTQAELGDLCGVSKTSICMWESGKTQPKGACLMLLSKHLQLEPESILANHTSVDTRSKLVLPRQTDLPSANEKDAASLNRSLVLLALAETLHENAIVSTIEEKSGILSLSELELLEGLILKSVEAEKANERWPPQ